MKVEIKWIIALLLFASCKPRELQQIELLRQHVVVHEPGRTISASIELESKSSAKQKFTYYWYANGRINQTQGGYSGKLLHGHYTVKDRATKNLLEQGEYKHGLRTGRWLVWSADGSLKDVHRYKDGLIKLKKEPDSTTRFNRIKKYIRSKLRFKRKEK